MRLGLRQVFRKIYFIAVLGILLWPASAVAIDLPKVDRAKDCSGYLNSDLIQDRMLSFYSTANEPVWILAEFDVLESGRVNGLRLVDSQPKIINTEEINDFFAGVLFQKEKPRQGCQLLLAHIPVTVR